MVDFLKAWRNQVILVAIAVTLVFTPVSAERYGDRLQILLPALGLGCSVLTGGTGEYVLRFTAMELGLHGSRAVLGDSQLNLRPSGSTHGFPSGHTTASTFGASALVHECIRNSPFTQAVVITAAAATGASRLDAGAHTIWQVLGGWIWGYTVERAFRKRRPRKMLATLKTAWRALCRRTYRA